jgi:hypothetical protein
MLAAMSLEQNRLAQENASLHARLAAVETVAAKASDARPLAPKKKVGKKRKERGITAPLPEGAVYLGNRSLPREFLAARTDTQVRLHTI